MQDRTFFVWVYIYIYLRTYVYFWIFFKKFRVICLQVHPCGRYRHNSVVFLLGKEHSLRNLHSMLLPLYFLCHVFFLYHTVFYFTYLLFLTLTCHLPPLPFPYIFSFPSIPLPLSLSPQPSIDWTDSRRACSSLLET